MHLAANALPKLSGTRRKKNQKLNYVHMNRVRRGLVRNPNQWAWRSYRAYLKTGTVLLAVDAVE